MPMPEPGSHKLGKIWLTLWEKISTQGCHTLKSKWPPERSLKNEVEILMKNLKNGRRIKNHVRKVF